MSRFLNSRIKEMESYVPGEQPKDKKYIKLNTNESPFPPSPGVIEAISSAAVSDLRLYCDPTASNLRQKLADSYGTVADRVFVSNGSDDILNFAFMAYGEGGAHYPDITYGFYSVFAKLHGVCSRVVPLRDDFSIDFSAFSDLCGLIVIANPNAPTGICVPPSVIEDLLIRNPRAVVLVDEAYIDFGGQSCVALTEKYDNLLVVFTFSKSRSMAGARLGFAIGCRDLISDLEKIKYSTNPYNVNSLTQLGGVAALCEDKYYKENCKRIIEAREYTEKELSSLGFTMTPGVANFIFAKSDRIGGRELYLALKERGILVRHFDKERISDYNRITVGSMDDMKKFVYAVKEILEER